MKKQIRESLTCDRCMKEVREFQVSLVSKFLESSYETRTNKSCIELCKIYNFDSFWNKICFTRHGSLNIENNFSAVITLYPWYITCIV